MDSVKKTLYIPLYGKAYASARKLFLRDERAEEIWHAEGFPLRGKAGSKWLAFYMAIRSAVFDRWVVRQLEAMPDAAVIHIGCGLDSRALRVNAPGRTWYDVDFPEVIAQRHRYYKESFTYHMVPGDVRAPEWLDNIPQHDSAIVVMEGISMYLSPEQLQALAQRLCGHFSRLAVLTDCYTGLAARMSKYKNPIREVGVQQVYGMDDPTVLDGSGLHFVAEHDMTPAELIAELTGMERLIFQRLYAGSLSRRLYRLFEYRKR